MLQFKVPQNIKMPDQIIGPLTLEQFLYLLFAAGISYIVYIYVGYNNYFWAIVLPVSCLALAFAFVPVNEQPFSKFFNNLIFFLIKPKILLWRQMPPEIFDVSPASIKKASDEEKEEIMHPEEVKSQLQQLSMILDNRTAIPREIRENLTQIKQETKVKPITVPAVPKIMAEKTKPANQTTSSPGQLSQIKAAITGLFSRPKKPSRSELEKISGEKEAKKEILAQIASSPARSK